MGAMPLANLSDFVNDHLGILVAAVLAAIVLLLLIAMAIRRRGRERVAEPTPESPHAAPASGTPRGVAAAASKTGEMASSEQGPGRRELRQQKRGERKRLREEKRADRSRERSLREEER